MHILPPAPASFSAAQTDAHLHGGEWASSENMGLRPSCTRIQGLWEGPFIGAFVAYGEHYKDYIWVYNLLGLRVRIEPEEYLNLYMKVGNPVQGLHVWDSHASCWNLRLPELRLTFPRPRLNNFSAAMGELGNRSSSNSGASDPRRLTKGPQCCWQDICKQRRTLNPFDKFGEVAAELGSVRHAGASAHGRGSGHGQCASHMVPNPVKERRSSPPGRSACGMCTPEPRPAQQQCHLVASQFSQRFAGNQKG